MIFLFFCFFLFFVALINYTQVFAARSLVRVHVLACTVFHLCNAPRLVASVEVKILLKVLIIIMNE